MYPDATGQFWLAPGDYGKGADGVWLARPPGISLGSLENHEVVEHEDGTITVSPSIKVTQPTADGVLRWHGYLKRGVWIEV